MSPSVTSGMRTLVAIMRTTSGFSTPRRWNLIIGNRMPSWKISVMPPATPPGAIPPMSTWWAMFPTSPISVPSSNTGAKTCMSMTCWPPR